MRGIIQYHIDENGQFSYVLVAPDGNTEEAQCEIEVVTCEDIPCFNPNSPVPVDITPPSSGGSSSTTSTASPAFNDKIKRCSESDPEAGERGSEAFCNAIGDIRLCDPQGLGNEANRHLLAKLSKITDSDRPFPDEDDEGMLSEVAEYVCNGGTADKLNVVENYVTYASTTGLDEVVSFEDYIDYRRVILEAGLDISVASFLGKIDWANSTDQEKIDKIMSRLRFNLYIIRCGLDVDNNTDLVFSDMFDNLPGWITGTTLNGTIPHSSPSVDFRLDFQGGGSCGTCISSSPDERTLPGGVIAYDFSACSSTGSTAVSCMSIYSDTGTFSSFEDYLFIECR